MCHECAYGSLSVKGLIDSVVKHQFPCQDSNMENFSWKEIALPVFSFFFQGLISRPTTQAGYESQRDAGKRKKLKEFK